MTATVDILLPTYHRSAALAVTLTSLIAQTFRDFRIVISDQTEDGNPLTAGEVQTVLQVLQAYGHAIEVHKHLPRRGMAEQRQFLLNQATVPYVLFLDDLILEPTVLRLMEQYSGCGLIPSRVYHQELPTTIGDRSVNAPIVSPAPKSRPSQPQSRSYANKHSV